MRQNASQYQPRPLFTAPIHTMISLDRSSGLPLYRQICQRLREAILSGELSEGTRLPTERALATELGVNRTTIMNAYNELASEGLIEGHVGRGTLVRRNQFGYLEDGFESETASWLLGLPAGEREILGPDALMLSELASMSESKEIISLAPGNPSPDLLPADMIHTIFADGLLSARQSALGYGPVEGLHNLRRAIAASTRKRGVAVDAQHILILSGSTQGIGLIGRFLLNPGDEVILFEPYYQYHISALLAVEAVPVMVKMQAPDWTVHAVDVERAVTPRTKAIIAMDYDCLLCDHDALTPFAQTHRLRVIHDAAHSFGSRYRGKMVGSFSDICMFSFDGDLPGSACIISYQIHVGLIENKLFSNERTCRN